MFLEVLPGGQAGGPAGADPGPALVASLSGAGGVVQFCLDLTPD
jgi:hypothetical protein